MNWSRSARRITGGLVLALAVAGCGDDESTNPDPALEAGPILENTSLNVMLATYQTLADDAAALKTATDALQGAPTEPNLEAARTAWRAARVPWEQSEGFLFGPVDTQGLDPAIDSWPVNVVDLDAVLASSDALTADYIDGLEGTLKGFHTIEYLLFGVTGDRSAASLTARELEYLSATCESLARATAQLAEAWHPDQGNFAGQLIEAGEEGSVYVSQKAALEELVNGLVVIADEVANGKINDPYVQQDATLEESRFSGNSITDFQDNIRSVQHIYMGDYASTVGAGLHDIVLEHNADLDGRVQARITGAIAAIGAIPPPFSQAIFDHGTEVEAAQAAVRSLLTVLQEELAPLVSSL